MIAVQSYGHHRFCSLRSSLTAKIILYNLCDRIRFSLWKKHGLLYRIMRSNHLFHPDHIIPTVKFITTMMKSSYRLKSKMSMELLTVFCQIFIFLLRIADTGVYIKNPHTAQLIYQCFIQPAAQTAFSRCMRHINREFTRPIICLSWIKHSCISIPLYDAIFLNHQIRILLHRSSHAASKLCYRWHFIFKGDRCFLYIIPIYTNQLGRIVQPCCSYRNFTHDKSLHFFPKFSPTLKDS